jgi:hypothetical protein
MKHIIDAFDRRRTSIAVADVALDEAEPAVERVRQLARDLVQVALMARGEIVERDDLLSAFEQGLDEVRSDEAGGAGDEPACRALGQALRKVGRENGISPKILCVSDAEHLFDKPLAVNALTPKM